MGLGASVGKSAANEEADVIVVQHLLNAWLSATDQTTLPVDGNCGPRTIAAIQAYQSRVLGATSPDGRIDPGGRIWNALSTGTGIPVLLSGAKWWHANQAKYPNSAAVGDLASPFRDAAAAFVKALKDTGASVTVSSTRRNRTRAYLMHYCWRVANGSIAPSAVPTVPGCRIQWDHGDLAKSRRAAKKMVDLFAIAYQPSLTSNHIEGRAIDMTIRWNGTISIRDKTGKQHKLAAPRTGEDNAQLHAIGATYGVKKLLSDPPHWSDDGR